MVKPAQRDEVRQLGLAALGPVPDVVPVHVALKYASRKPAALVPRIQGSAYCRRDGPGLATDVERLASLVFDDSHDAGVTSEPPGRFCGDGRPMLEFATAGMAVLQGPGIHVHDDLVAVFPGQVSWPGRKEVLGQRGQGLDPALAHAMQVVRRRFRGNVFRDGQGVLCRLQRLDEQRPDLGRQSTTNRHRAIRLRVVPEGLIPLLDGLAAQLLGVQCPSISSHHLLDVARRPAECDIEQVTFVCRSCHARQGPDLGVAESAL